MNTARRTHEQWAAYADEHHAGEQSAFLDGVTMSQAEHLVHVAQKRQMERAAGESPAIEWAVRDARWPDPKFVWPHASRESAEAAASDNPYAQAVSRTVSVWTPDEETNR